MLTAEPLLVAVAGVPGAGLSAVMAALEAAGLPVVGRPPDYRWEPPEHAPWALARHLRAAFLEGHRHRPGVCHPVAARVDELKSWNCWTPRNLNLRVILVERSPSEQARRWIEKTREWVLRELKGRTVPTPEDHAGGVELGIRAGMAANRRLAEHLCAAGPGRLWLAVRYEYLLFDPVIQLQKIQALLGNPAGFDVIAGAAAFRQRPLTPAEMQATFEESV